MTDKYHDRFSEAFDELNEKNAFVCHTCGSNDIGRVDKRKAGGKNREREEENVSLHIAKTKTEKAIYSDPSPLGP